MLSAALQFETILWFMILSNLSCLITHKVSIWPAVTQSWESKKKKNQTFLRYSQSSGFCHMRWNNNAHLSALRQQGLNPSPVHLPWRQICSPQWEQLHNVSDHCAAASSSGETSSLSPEKLEVTGGTGSVGCHSASCACGAFLAGMSRAHTMPPMKRGKPCKPLHPTGIKKDFIY